MFFEIWKTDFMKKMDDDLVKRLERRKSKKRQTRRKLPNAPKIVTRVVIFKICFGISNVIKMKESFIIYSNIRIILCTGEGAARRPKTRIDDTSEPA